MPAETRIVVSMTAGPTPSGANRAGRATSNSTTCRTVSTAALAPMMVSGPTQTSRRGSISRSGMGALPVPHEDDRGSEPCGGADDAAEQVVGQRETRDGDDQTEPHGHITPDAMHRRPQPLVGQRLRCANADGDIRSRAR